MTFDVQTKTRVIDDVLTEYAAGTLSPVKHTLVSCQRQLCENVDARLSFEESVASSLLTKTPNAALSDGFLSGILAKLPADNEEAISADEPNDIVQDLMTLIESPEDIPWDKNLFGVSLHDVCGNRHYKDERLYFLKVKAGMKMPTHSHRGEEWSLIVKGNYNVGGEVFSKGDLHIEDESTTHQPVIGEGGECICLVMTEGPLKMKDFLPKIIQPFIGI